MSVEGARERVSNAILRWKDELISWNEVEHGLDHFQAEVLREAADKLLAKYGVTNRAAGDLRQAAGDIEKG